MDADNVFDVEIGSPPAIQQVTRFGIGMWYYYLNFIYLNFGAALAIILEHSFHLWYHSSSKIDYLSSAIGAYESSGKHAIISAAVDRIFEEEGQMFEEAKRSSNPEDSVLAKQLAQIAVDNHFCMFWFVTS